MMVLLGKGTKVTGSGTLTVEGRRVAGYICTDGTNSASVQVHDASAGGDLIFIGIALSPRHSGLPCAIAARSITRSLEQAHIYSFSRWRYERGNMAERRGFRGVHR